VIHPADRTQAIERGNAHAGRRVRIGGPAGRGITNLETEPSRERPGMVDKVLGARQLLHRPPAGHDHEFGAGIRDNERPEHRSDLGLDCLEVGPPDGPDIELKCAPIRHNVGARPAADHPDADRDALAPSVELVEPDHEVCRGQDRASPFLRLDPRVSGAPPNDDAGIENPLARRHDVAVGPGTLEDEARIGRRGELADVGSRRRRADLLVGIGDERESLEREASFGEDRAEGVEAR
jgi:hypothetical protein